MVIQPLNRSPVFYNRVSFIKGVPASAPTFLPVIQGQQSVYLESMRKLREVLNYGNTHIA